MLHGTPKRLINSIPYCHHFSITMDSYFASFVTFPFVMYKINIIDIVHFKLGVLKRAVSVMNKAGFLQTDTKEAGNLLAFARDSFITFVSISAH